MNKNRFSTEELEEFRQIIIKKLNKATEDFRLLKKSISEGAHKSSNYSSNLEDNPIMDEREQNSIMADRQLKFINSLKKAICRINDGSYGICQVTGKNINKDRLRLVPHTTHSIEAKNQRF